jgi:hypothetical protein
VERKVNVVHERVNCVERLCAKGLGWQLSAFFLLADSLAYTSALKKEVCPSRASANFYWKYFVTSQNIVLFINLTRVEGISGQNAEKNIHI